MAHNRIHNILTIAGSDSGGGAGIQADIKAISATNSFACSVITALTAQNTQTVSDIYPIPTDFIAKQLDVVFSDIEISAVKLGMLASKEVIQCVVKKLHQYQPPWLVIDPVMVATSGDLLLDPLAIETMKTQLLPLADVITPNLPEAAALVGCAIPSTTTQLNQLIDKLKTLDCQAVLLKGGHFADAQTSQDYLITAHSVETYTAKRINTMNTHGTGCTLSSAIASYLPQSASLNEAVAKAKAYISLAIAHADELNVGQGHGPVHHFYHQQPNV